MKLIKDVTQAANIDDVMRCLGEAFGKLSILSSDYERNTNERFTMDMALSEIFDAINTLEGLNN